MSPGGGRGARRSSGQTSFKPCPREVLATKRGRDGLMTVRGSPCGEPTLENSMICMADK